MATNRDNANYIKIQCVINTLFLQRHTACGLGNSLLDSPGPKGPSEPAVNAK